MLVKFATTHIDKVFKSYKTFNSFIKIAGKTDKEFSTRVLNKVASIPIIQADPDKFLFIRNRSISGGETWGANQNYDYFPSKELEEKYSTFLNCRVSIDHKFEDDEDSIGIVLDSTYVPKQIYNERTLDLIPFSEEKLAELTKVGEKVRITGDYIENLLAIEKVRANSKRPGLVEAIVRGEVSDTSMGCSVEKSECSVCHNVAETENEFCEHISYGKGRKFKVGEKEVIAYEINHGINFFEDSVILSEDFAKKSGFRAEAGGEGADARAKIVEVIAGEKKTAKKTNSILDYIKAADMGQIPVGHMYNNSVTIGEPDPEVEEMEEEIREDLQDDIEDKKSIFKRCKTEEEFLKNAKHLDSEFRLKRFWTNANKSDKNDVLGLVKVFLKDGIEEKEIFEKLEGIGYNSDIIKEALEYENLTNMDNKIIAELKDYLVTGYRLFEKISGGFDRGDNVSGEDMNPVAPELDRHQDFVENFPNGVQEPASENSNGEDNPIWEKYQTIRKRIAEINMEEDVVNKDTEGEMTKEGEPVDKLDNERVSTKRISKQVNYWKDEHVKEGEDILNGIGIMDEDGFYGKEPIEFSKDSGDPETYNDHKNRDKEFETSDIGYVRAKIKEMKDRLSGKQNISPKDDEASVSTKEPDGNGKVKKDTYKSDEKEMLADYPVAGSANEKISYLKQRLGRVSEVADDLVEDWEKDKENYKFDNADKLPKDRTEGNLEKEVKKAKIKRTAFSEDFEPDPQYQERGSEFTDEDFRDTPNYPEFEADDLFDINNPPSLHDKPAEELEKYQDWLSEKLFKANLTPEDDKKITQLLDRISAELGKHYPSQDYDYEALEGLAKKSVGTMNSAVPTDLQPGAEVRIFKKDDAGNPTSEQVDTGAINTVEVQEGLDTPNTDVNVNNKNYSTDDFIVEKTGKSQLLNMLKDLDVDDKMDKLSALRSIAVDDISFDNIERDDQFKSETENYKEDFGDLFEDTDNPEPVTVAKKEAVDLTKPGLKRNIYSKIQKEEKKEDEDLDLETMFDDDNF